MSTLERQPAPPPDAQPAPVAVQAEALTIYLEIVVLGEPANRPALGAA